MVGQANEHEVVEDAGALAFGDLVRLPKRKTWWVVFDVGWSGPDVVRDVFTGRAIELRSDVSREAAYRAEHGEMPGTNVRMYSPLIGRWATVAPPVERIREPLPFLLREPVDRTMCTLIAFHARDREVEAGRRGWGLRSELESVIVEATARARGTA